MQARGGVPAFLGRLVPKAHTVLRPTAPAFPVNSRLGGVRNVAELSSKLSASTKVIEVLNKNKKPKCTIGPEETLRSAAQKMIQNNVACLLVVGQDGKCQGIVTERDYLRTSVEHTNLEVPVKKFMTPRDRMTFVAPTDNLYTCMEIMTKKGFRHIPVFDVHMPVGKKLLGVISIRDIIQQLTEDQAAEIGRLTEYITGHY